MHHKQKKSNVHTVLDNLEKQLLLAKEMDLISHLEFKMSGAEIHFSQKVTFDVICKFVRHINQNYKNIAYVPSSLYLTHPRKRIMIHYLYESTE